MTRFARSRRDQLMVRTALCGAVTAALLAAAPARAQVGVAGLKLPGGVLLTTANLDAASRCGASPSTCTDVLLLVNATGNATNPQTNIFVNEPRTIINWSQFDLTYTNPKSRDTVDFIFNGRDDIVINLITSPTASATQIDGVLNGIVPNSPVQSGGNIWIINPAGIVFGANSVVNTGGLLATTSSLTAADQTRFLGGGDGATFTFSVPAPAGSSVQVGGAITGYGGTLAFIAPVVVTIATANISGAPPATGACALGTLPCATDVLYGAADAFNITFAPNANNDLDLFSFIVPLATDGTASTTPMSLNGVTSAGNVYIAAVNQAGVVGDVVAPGAVSATLATGANGDIFLAAGGSIVATGTSTTPNEIQMVAGAGTTNTSIGALSQGGVPAGIGDIVIGSDGNVAIGAPVSNAPFSAGPAFTVVPAEPESWNIVASGDVDAPGTLSAPNASIYITGATFNLGSVVAPGQVSLTANGSIGTGAVGTATGGFVNIDTVGALTVTNSLTGTSGSIDITAGGPLNAGAAVLSANTGDFLGDITVTASSFDIGTAIATGFISLTGTAPAPSFINTAATANGGDITVTDAGPLSAGGAVLTTTAGDIMVSAASFDIGTATSSGAISVTGTGAGASAIETAATAQGGNLTVTAAGAFTSTGAVLSAPAGDASVTADTFALGRVSSDVTTIEGTGTGAYSIAGAVTSTDGDLNVTAAGPLAAPAATLSSTTGAVNVSAASFDIGTVTARGVATLSATGPGAAGTGQIDPITAASITITTSGNFTLLTNATATTGDLDITAGGAVTATGATLQATLANVNISGASFDLGTVTAGEVAGLAATGAGTVATLTGGTGATVNTGGAFTVTGAATTTTGDLAITAGGAFTSTGATVTAPVGDVTITAATFDIDSVSSELTTLKATGTGTDTINVSAMSTGGDLDITTAGPLAAANATLTAGGEVDVTSSSFDIGTAQGGSIDLAADGAGALLAVSTAGVLNGRTGITVTTTGDFDLTTSATASNARQPGNIVITAQGVVAAGGAILTAQFGDITVQGLTFDIGQATSRVTTFTATGTAASAVETSATSTAGDLDITAEGPLNAGAATLASTAPTGNVNVSAASFDIGTATAPAAVNLTATGAGASQAGTVAGGTGVTVNTGGAFTVTAALTATTGDLAVTDGGAFTSTGATVTAPVGTATITADTFTIDSVSSDTTTLKATGTGADAINVAATSTAGDLDITAAGPLNAGAATLSSTGLGGNVNVSAQTFDIGTATAPATVNLSGTGAGASQATTVAGGTGVTVNTGGAFTVTETLTTETGNLAVTDGGAFTSTGATVTAPAGTATITADTFTIDSVSSEVTTLKATGTGADAINVAATSTAGDLDITAGGPLNAGAATFSSTAPTGNVNVSAASFDIGTATAPAAVNLTATGAGASQAGTVAGGTGVTVNTGGAFTVTAALTATAGNLAVIDGGAFTSTGTTVKAPAGTATITADTFTIDSVSSDTTTLKGTGTGADAINVAATSTAGDLDITAGGPLNAGAATLSSTAPTGNVNVSAASFDIGTATAPAAVSLTATGAAASQAGTVTGGTDVTVNTGGAFTVSNVAMATTGDVDITSATGPVTAPIVTAANGNVTISAGPNGTADPANAITIGQVTAGQKLTLQGGAVALTGASSAGGAVLVRTGAFSLGALLSAGAGGVTIASTAGALNLGDNVQGGAAGLNVSNAAFGKISTSGAVTFIAGDPGNAALGDAGSAARGDLTVGTLAVNGSNIGQLVLLADNGHDVSFTGPVTSTGATPANLVVGQDGPWNPNAILIEAAGTSEAGPAGSIGTAAAPFGSVGFFALNDIVMGTPGFIQATGAVPGSAINVTAGLPPVPAGAAPVNGEILLATQTATFLADGRIVQQNTSTSGGFSGLLIETPSTATQSLFLGCLTCATQPGVIDLFGAIDTPGGVAITGPAMALSPQIALLSPLGINVQYRANGCVIGDAGDCQPGGALPILSMLDYLPPTNTIEALLASLSTPPLLTVGDYEGQADVTIIGSGNEEIWRKPDDSSK